MLKGVDHELTAVRFAVNRRGRCRALQQAPGDPHTVRSGTHAFHGQTSPQYQLSRAVLVVVWIWLSKRFGRGFRITTLALLPLIYAAQWYGVEMLEGWPAKDKVPDAFELVSADVREPDQLRDDGGGIYLWLRLENDRDRVPTSCRMTGDA